MRNNNKRPRGRQQPTKRPVNPKFQNFDSNGPDGRVRGNAQQVHEKYVSLAKDCTDDPVLAENYYQHAEHYYRILQAAQEWENQRREERGGDNNNRNRNNNNVRNNRDDRNDTPVNQGDDQRGENTEIAANAAPDGEATSSDAENAASENTEAASVASADDKPKRAPRARRTDGRPVGRGRPRKSDDANVSPAAANNAPVEATSDDAASAPAAPAPEAVASATAVDADGADQGDDGEKKPRRASSSTTRTRGRHPTARRGRSRAAGRDDEDTTSSDEGSEPVSA